MQTVRFFIFFLFYFSRPRNRFQYRTFFIENFNIRVAAAVVDQEGCHASSVMELGDVENNGKKLKAFTTPPSRQMISRMNYRVDIYLQVLCLSFVESDKIIIFI